MNEKIKTDIETNEAVEEGHAETGGENCGNPHHRSRWPETSYLLRNSHQYMDDCPTCEPAN